MFIKSKVSPRLPKIKVNKLDFNFNSVVDYEATEILLYQKTVFQNQTQLFL